MITVTLTTTDTSTAAATTMAVALKTMAPQVISRAQGAWITGTAETIEITGITA